MKTILLVDADIIVYRSGFAAEKKKYVVTAPVFAALPLVFETHADAIEFITSHSLEDASVEHTRHTEPVENALHNVNSIIKQIKEAVPHTNVEVFLTGKGNFRHEVATLKKYKGNRDNVARPVHYDAIRNHLIYRWNAKVVEGMEADDELGIRATEIAMARDCPIICSTDKDLDMIPCKHYNWVKGLTYNVTDEEAYRCFCRQLLTGDRTDNIPGIQGVGDVTATKLLKDCRSPNAMRSVVRETWDKHYPSGYTKEDGTVVSVTDVIKELSQLLWIRRSRE